MSSTTLELQSRLQSLITGGSSSSPLAPSNPSAGFLGNNRSSLSDPLLAGNAVRASASATAVAPEPGNTRSTAYNIGALSATKKNLLRLS
ncbi:hypothetical protein K9N68_24280 [Kovacikia minuta CCNUW1]|uniref:hypothetical protein n=1 Tax=Kovacikia minuta TaxID=2931930 RepID=UPI001CCD5E22|nr:hypothetical protein [Kovacikia minuta]UBF24759.1 hypothetical protein K9N68_24280 [Kovacikia minuta CCNUW1]